MLTENYLCLQNTQNKNVIESLEEMENFVNNFLSKISNSHLFSCLLQSFRLVNRLISSYKYSFYRYLLTKFYNVLSLQ